ncbi:MAG: BNR/Asp-box repeat protein [Chloroflexi bacterium ADurb.Bin360]|nr:MAG: BNR/Asp-box repeat protein [Chloroflexi bacterium ADurb.Bin360]
MNKVTPQRFFLYLSLCYLLLAFSAPSAKSQSRELWSSPIQLHLLSSGDATAFPDAVADSFGRLHVVTVRNPRGQEADYPKGIVYYTRWDGEQWTRPLDILAAPNQNTSGVERLRVSPDGQLYLLWSELNSGLYWSRSISLDAASAQAWTTELAAARATVGDFVFTSEQDVALVYVDNSRDIYFRGTTDGGANWTHDILIWSPQTDRQATFTVRFESDANGVYHVVWTENDQDLGWEPSGIWYARSVDRGQTWQDFYHVPDQGSFINVGFDSTGNVHLLWDHSVGSEDGRYHAISHDGGVTWSEPRWIFPGLSGRTGFPRMILDSTGRFHQFTSGRGNGLEGGIYHSIWLDDRWSDPVLVSDPVPDNNNEGPVVAITNGNLLHVVYRNVREIGDILYSHLTIDAPYKESDMFPAVPPIAAGVAEADVGETRQSHQGQNTDRRTETIDATRQPLASSPPPFVMSQSTVVLLAVFPVILLLAAVILLHRRRI